MTLELERNINRTQESSTIISYLSVAEGSIGNRPSSQQLVENYSKRPAESRGEEVNMVGSGETAWLGSVGRQRGVKGHTHSSTVGGGVGGVGGGVKGQQLRDWVASKVEGNVVWNIRFLPTFQNKHSRSTSPRCQGYLSHTPLPEVALA